jgi:hypothetical protein
MQLVNDLQSPPPPFHGHSPPSYGPPHSHHPHMPPPCNPHRVPYGGGNDLDFEEAMRHSLEDVASQEKGTAELDVAVAPHATIEVVFVKSE